MVPCISVREARELLAASNPPRLIDVREQDEWDLCHIEGAELLPLSQWPSVIESQLSKTDEPLILLCHHGARSYQAASFLQSRGYSKVWNLDGGIDAWSVEIDASIPRY